MSLTLDVCADPVRLVPGDASQVRTAANTYLARAEAYGHAASSITKIDTSEAWSGVAADQFASAIGLMPPNLRRAESSHTRAGDALKRYANELDGAQAQAARAVELWNTGVEQSADAHVQHQRALRAATMRAQRDSVYPIQISPPPIAFFDPGVTTRERADALLFDARQAEQDAGEDAVREVEAAADEAPEGPSFWDNAGAVWSQVWHESADMGSELLNGLASLGNAMINNPGATALTVGGIILMDVGIGMEGGGIAFDLTGVGAIVGVPLNIAGAAVITAGAGMTAAGGSILLKEASGASRINPVGKVGRGEASPPRTAQDLRATVNEATSPGKNSDIRVTKTESELQALIDKITESGTETSWRHYKGTAYRLEDGTEIGVRDTSKSGGRTLDINYPDATTVKVHISHG